GGLVEGRAAAVGQRGGERVRAGGGLGGPAARRTGRVEVDLPAPVARPPAALVGGLAQRDAVEPGAQAGLAVESADVAEDLEEDLLGDVGGVGGVLQAARDQRVERLVVLVDQLGEGLLGAALKL